MPTDRSLSVLPLSHIFERSVFYVLACNGVAVHYCSAFEQLAPGLQEVQPTVMTAVPRLFEQVYHKIVKKGMSAGGWKTKLFSWALEIGQEYWDYKEKRKSCSDRLWRQNMRLPINSFFQNGGQELAANFVSLFRVVLRFPKN